MGLLDTIKNGITEMQEEQKREKERQAQAQLKEQECSKDRTIYLQPTFGHAELGLQNPVCMRQKLDETVYFGIDDDVRYRLIGYEWGGAVYEHMVSSQTNANSNTVQHNTSAEVKKGKSGKMAAGALIGTMIMPGIGTAVGAAIGAGGKSKKNTIEFSNANTQNNSNTQQVTKNVEQNTTAIIRLKRISDGTVHSLTVVCNTAIDAKLRCFNVQKEKNVSDVSTSAEESLRGIKALKELLDMGAITQEEFDAKKSQMLNI